MQKEDSSRWNLFHLLDDGGREHLAVIGEVRPYIWSKSKIYHLCWLSNRLRFQLKLEPTVDAQ